MNVAMVCIPLLAISLALLWEYRKALYRLFLLPSRVSLPNRSPVLRFMRQAQKYLCYEHIYKMEQALYGKYPVDRQKCGRSCSSGHGYDMHRIKCPEDIYAIIHDGSKASSWMREFRLPPPWSVNPSENIARDL
jgi:hypothetical protein